ncbi:proteasome-associated protein ECM29 -like [Asbolus verrucosus]|uniref:Proteasome-associated protein ECM29-like n=1 Tax=Asbolus verrucosus TaxID=1661398 RepID=A0A482VI08_ASBVE|nr:proteasome-associated protein ECM29 -like [Asbolus verrucosus]
MAMADIANELMLLERVFLRLGLAETDEQLQNLLAKFLTPVLLKLASSEEGVMELLIHVNKRVKTRPQIQLPVEALLMQYQDPAATSFVTNFTIIYIKLGFPRLPIEKQAELVPVILNALEQKPVAHLDSILLLVIPVLGKVKMPTEPEKISTLFGLNEKPHIAKHLLDMLLDVLLLPYGALSPQTPDNEQQRNPNVTLPVPPCMSQNSFRRITVNNPLKPEELEEIKLGIVRFLAHGVFKDEDVLIHLVVAASDTRFSVANLADMELKKVVGSVDWGSVSVVMPLFTMFLGTQSKNVKEDQIKSPASTRIRLKLLTYLCRITGKAADEGPLSKVAPVLLSGMQKLIKEGEEIHQGQAYVLIGTLAQRFPNIVYHDINLLETFFKNLEIANPDLKLQIREGLLHLILAYKYDIYLEEADKDGRLNILFAIIKFRMGSEESMVRFAAVRTLATIFPPEHVPSKYLLLLLTGDGKDDVCAEAFKALYGTARKSDVDLSKTNKIVTPQFPEIISYVYSEAEVLVKDASKRFSIGNHVLPFNLRTYVEILIYLRLCLVRNLDIPLKRDILNHPCEHTPVITEYLQGLFDESKPMENNPVLQYTSLLNSFISKDIQWIRDQLNSTKEEVREYASVLYALVLSKFDVKEFDSAIHYLLKQTENKNLEAQHGAILGTGTCLEYKITSTSSINKELYKNAVTTLVAFLKQQNPLLVGGACTSLGSLGRSCALPLEDGKPKEVGSPDAKRPANDIITKIDVVSRLMDVMNNSKLSAKIREKAAKALGLLCVGEKFPHTKEIVQGFLNTAKETKDVEVHFTIGESLVMCCQSIWSPEARNPWTTLPQNHIPNTNEIMVDDNLDWLLEELLKLANQHHPNSKQASCIWLLAILKGCGEREPITKKLQSLQNTFMDLLCENNEELLTALVKQLTSGTRQVTHVTDDTKLFEEGQLGKSPTGGNLTTYKELCSLASDLNKPDLIYQFMHLANHNAIWNSKKGAAFGFTTIAERCGEDLKAHLPLIIPKLYRYQFDPTPNIQASMHNIWRVLVGEPQKTLDEYYDQILADLLENINSNQYRIRQSCCMALQDFLKGSSNRSIHDCVNSMDELWTKLFRVMDDHHEATRLTATKTARILSKLCIRGCDASQGKAGVKMVEAILPPLLNNGITNTVAEIRLISLQTISELVGSAGVQLKPFLPKLIPALLQATGELESAKLSYLSTMLGAQSQAQEAIDSARASFAKSHFTTETVSKSLQYADASILEELVPKVVELLKGSIGLGTRIACTHFITLLVVHLGQDLQPYTGKLLAALVNGLTDRNAAIRKHYAVAIGHLVSTAKESSLEKLFAKLQHWYFEREDDSIRSACAYTIQSIGIHNQEVLKCHSDVILPLVFFAMHCEKTPETENTLEVWTEIWSEHSPGTETGIRQNIEVICDILKTALESPSWTMKAQAASAVSTVASKLGTTMEGKHRNALINILLNGLSGRTWNGKDKLLKALASICSNCKEAIKEDEDVKVDLIIEAVIKESRKEEINYKISALESLGDILSALQIDKFDEVYVIIQSILTDDNSGKEEDEDISSDEIAKKREKIIKLKETAYETLGKTWPENSKVTQEKYGEMFVEHCVKCLPRITRSVQVSVVSALYNYVDKLILLNEELDGNDKKTLAKIVDNIVIAIKYALGISKHTRLRKESLNVVFCMGKKLKEKNREEELLKLRDMFNQVLAEISGDNQPEIKSRLTDIKNLLKTN